MKEWQTALDAFKWPIINSWGDLSFFFSQLKKQNPYSENSLHFEQFLALLDNGIAIVSLGDGTRDADTEAKRIVSLLKRYAQNDESPLYLKVTDRDWEGNRQLFGDHGDDEFVQSQVEQIWSEAKRLAIDLASQVSQKNITCLLICDYNTEPRHLPLMMATIIVSEVLSIPVISYYSSFFRLTGMPEKLRKAGEKKHVSDYYFGASPDVLVLLQILYPWSSKRWQHWVVSGELEKQLIYQYGINPSSVQHLPLVVNTQVFYPHGEDLRQQARQELSDLLKSTGELKIQSVFDLAENCAQQIINKPLILGNDEFCDDSFLSHGLVVSQLAPFEPSSAFDASFLLCAGLFHTATFVEFLNNHRHLNIVLLFSGCVDTDHWDYLNFIISRYKSFLERLGADQQQRIYLALLIKQSESGSSSLSLSRSSLYSVSDLVVDHFAGKDYPHVIHESSASGVPLLVNSMRPIPSGIQCATYRTDCFSTSELRSICQLIIDPDFGRKMILENRRCVEKEYKESFLKSKIYEGIEQLWWHQAHGREEYHAAVDALALHAQQTAGAPPNELVGSVQRSYRAGDYLFSKQHYLLWPQILVDLRAMLFDFALRLLSIYTQDVDKKLTWSPLKSFYLAVEKIFDVPASSTCEHFKLDGYDNRQFFYLSQQELCGVVGILFRQYFSSWPVLSLERFPLGHVADLRSSIILLAKRGEHPLVIDQSDRLLSELISHRPYGVMPGHYFEQEIRIFAINTMKERMGISLQTTLTQSMIDSCDKQSLGWVSFFARRLPLNDISYHQFIHWMQFFAPIEAKLLWKANLLRIIPDDNLARGIHLGQMGVEAENELTAIKENNGFIVATSNNSLMLNLIELNCFHIGQVKTKQQVNLLGMRMDDCFLAWTPSGLRPALNQETFLQFSTAFTSDLYDDCVRYFGESNTIKQLYAMSESEEGERPLVHLLEDLLKTKIDQC